MRRFENGPIRTGRHRSRRHRRQARRSVDARVEHTIRVTAISDEELDELTWLSKSAAPGPWRHTTEAGESEGLEDPTEPPGWEVVTAADHPNMDLASEMDPADAQFVVAARTYVPLLVEEIRRLDLEWGSIRAGSRIESGSRA